MSTKILILILITLAVVAGTFYTLSKNASSPLVIRAGTLQGGISTLDIMDFYNMSGKYNVVLQVYRFEKTTDILAALAKGDIDVAVIPSEMAAKLLENNVSVQIISPEMLQNQALLTIKQGISTPDDLRSKTIVTTLSTGTYMLFKAYMKAIYNISVIEQPSIAGNSSIIALNTIPGMILNSLADPKVDAVLVWEPSVSKGIVSYNATVIATFKALWSKANLSGEPVMLLWVAQTNTSSKLIDLFLQMRADAVKVWKEDKNATITMLERTYGLSHKEAEFLYDRVTILDNQLTSEVIEGIRNVWQLAWKGGYLPADPSYIGDQVFYRKG